MRQLMCWLQVGEKLACTILEGIRTLTDTSTKHMGAAAAGAAADEGSNGDGAEGFEEVEDGSGLKAAAPCWS